MTRREAIQLVLESARRIKHEFEFDTGAALRALGVSQAEIVEARK